MYQEKERSRGHGLILYQPRSRLNLRKENFPMQIINIWNELPENVVMSPSVNTFQNRLDKHWSTEHFLCDYTAAIPGHNRAEDRARSVMIKHAGSCAYTRVHACPRGYMRVHTGTRGFTRVRVLTLNSIH